MDIISQKKIFLGIAFLFVFASWVLVFVFGLQQGIDLKGGTQWQIAVSGSVAAADLQNTLSEAGAENISVKETAAGNFIIRLPDTGEEEHQALLTALQEKFGEIRESSFSSIGPTIGRELKRKAIIAGAAVLFGISFFIAWAFRKVSHPIKSWKYGVVTLFTLFHDVSIPIGLLAVLGAINGIEIDTNFIVALLVVMGFSVHDTIVVFDRIRENLLIRGGKNIPLSDIFNRSIGDTLARSVNTSLTLVFVLLALLILGPPSLFYFILVILVGTVAGTYSSIFVASPLLYAWSGVSKTGAVSS